MRRPAQVAAFLPRLEVAGGAPAGDGGVDLEHGGEHHVGQGQAGAPLGLLRLGDAPAEAVQQVREPFPLVRLGLVVGGPVLLVGGALRLGDDGGAVRPFLALDADLDGADVLALGPP